MAKKIYKSENLFEKSEKKIRQLIKAQGVPYYIKFYETLDKQTSMGKEEEIIK